jgi:hypothetical protein
VESPPAALPPDLPAFPLPDMMDAIEMDGCKRTNMKRVAQWCVVVVGLRQEGQVEDCGRHPVFIRKGKRRTSHNPNQQTK